MHKTAEIAFACYDIDIFTAVADLTNLVHMT